MKTDNPTFQLLTALIDEAAAAGRVLLFAYGRHEYTMLSGGRGHYLFDRADGERIIAEFARRGVEIPADYEHQALLAKINGKPAPASGWVTALRLTEAGLEADVTWTETAARMIAAKEYRYTSPAFPRGEDGRVLGLINFALTNLPATDRCQELVAASQTYQMPGETGDTKERTMKNVLTLLGLADDAPETDAEAKVKELIAALAAAAETRAKTVAALGLTGDVSPGQVQGAILALKQSGDAVTALSAQVAELRTAQDAGTRQALIDAALSDGRLSNAQKPWADTVALDVLSGYLEHTPKGLVPVQQAQGGAEARQDAETTLSAADSKVARACGLDPDKVQEAWKNRPAPEA